MAASKKIAEVRTVNLAKAPEDAYRYSSAVRNGDPADFRSDLREFKEIRERDLKKSMEDYQKDEAAYKEAIRRATGRFKDEVSSLDNTKRSNSKEVEKIRDSRKHSQETKRKISLGLKRYNQTR